MSTINLPAYFETIKKKTGKTPMDFRRLAEEKQFMVDGVFVPSVKPMDVFNWLKSDFDLGRGHGMAIYHALKEGLY